MAHSFSNPIKKIVWSSFDYTSGPILNLSLEYFFESGGCDQSFHESSASSSSPLEVLSTQEQFEDIDDIFNSQLITVDPCGSPQDTAECSFSTLSEKDLHSPVPDLNLMSKEMVESAVDSGIATNHSVHSELSQALSNSGHNFPEELTPSFSEMRAELSNIIENCPHGSPPSQSPIRATSASSSKSNHSISMPMNSQNELLFSMSGEIGLPLMSDEEYVAKHALAEQISGNFISCDPIIHKLTVIPTRALAFGSYIFWPDPASHDMTIHAFSILLNDLDEIWYTEHRRLFDHFMDDLITVFKSRFNSGEPVELLNDFLDEEFKKLISMVSSLKTWIFGTREFKPEDNLLLIDLPSDYVHFLHRAIAGVIMSRGHTYVFGGTDYNEIRRMMLTLSLFLDETTIRLCLNPYSTPINPYLCLQVVNEKEFQEMRSTIVSCRWPACIVDMKHKKVYFSGPYWEHEKRRETYSSENSNHSESLKNLHQKLKLSVVNSLPSQYSSLLSSVRSFPGSLQNVISHFHLLMRNEARTFIELVKVLSEPSKESKTNPYSSRFRLSEINHILRMNTNEEFGIVLSNAEFLLPSISDFISENAQLPG
ncbi:hypothetical protein FO519_000757 [Halicephalobus sp. NKZ332]|nr:hypothetical protein FO519_000757 [Halicephalobus sp. NKZ332]